MGVAIPQFIPEDRASGALNVEGSFTAQGTYNGSPFYMKRTPASAGNRRTFTWSFWFKRNTKFNNDQRFLSVDDSSGDQAGIKFIDTAGGSLNNYVQFFDRQSSSFTLNFHSLAQYTDPSGWYNLVVACDTTQATNTDRVHIYMNGEEVAYNPSYDDYPTQNLETRFNNTTQHNLFAGEQYNSQIMNGQVSQICWIDGQQLDPTYFGFTDPLTGGWRPKKFNISDTPTGSWGTCGYYLPMDGSAHPGEDQSGQGNDWQSVNGGRSGCIAIDKATGAIPIRNATGGGHVLSPRVRGNAGVAVTVYDDGGGNKYYLDGKKTGNLDFVRGQTVTFNTGDSTVSGHPFRFSGVSNGAHNAMYGVSFDGSNDTLTIPDNADFELGSGDFTIEAWVKGDDTTQQSYTTVISKFQSSNFSWMIRWSSDDIEREAWSFFYSTTGSNYITVTGAPLDDQKWHHLVVARSGGTIRCYTDGIINDTKTTTDTFYSGTADVVIGSDQNSNYFDGIISDVRVTKGEALYTGGGFTPPSAPMTTTSQGATASNVKLLCCNGSSVTASTVTPGTITNSGSTSSDENPYDTYPYATVTGAISPGTVGAATTITFPHNAPDSLYYYCTAHSGMGGSGIIGLGTDIQKADPYAWKCVLALPYGDNMLDQSSEVSCTSTEYPVDNTTYGDPAMTTDTSQFYGNSLYLDGNDAVSLGIINDSVFEFGGSDWCIEFWFRGDVTLDASYWNPLISLPWTGSSNNYSQIWIGFAGGASGSYQTGELHSRLNAKVSGSLVKTELDTQNSKVYDDKMWHHIAVTKENYTARIYLDGELKEAASIGFAMNTDLQNCTGWIGGYANHGGTSGTSISAYSKGYFNDFKIYKGIAKYTEDYFLPASPDPTIRLDSPSGVAYKSDFEPTTTGSVQFDGTGDKLSIASHADLQIGSSSYTMEFWVYKNADTPDDYDVWAAKGSNNNNTKEFALESQADQQLDWYYSTNGGSWSQVENVSGGAIRSKMWHHIAFTKNSSTNYFAFFVNGKRTYYSTTGGETLYTGGDAFCIAGFADANTVFECNVKISNFRFIKGSCLYNQDFVPSTTPLTNITNTKLLCCQSTTSATAGVSPNTITTAGEPAASKFNPLDTNIDTVQSHQSNYATLNDLNPGSYATLYDGGLRYDGGTTGGNNTIVVTDQGVPANSGKWYCEFKVDIGTSYPEPGVARLPFDDETDWDNYMGENGDTWMYYNGTKYHSGSTASYGGTYGVGDIVGMVLDTDGGGSISWHLNGVDQGIAYNDLNSHNNIKAKTFHFGCGANTQYVIFNFGQKPFAYPPPKGCKTLCTANLPSKNIARSDTYVGTVLYTGDGATNRSIYGLNFQPDFMWFAPRNEDNWRTVFDSVRGDGKSIYTNSNWTQESLSNTGGVPLKDGFTVGYNSSYSAVFTNKNSVTYVAWCWKAGGNKNTFNKDDVGYASAAAAGLTAGTNPSVDVLGSSVGTKQGFSIIKYNNPDGGTHEFPHGLTEAPQILISKKLATADWYVHTSAIDGSVDYSYLNSTNTFSASSRTFSATTAPMINSSGDYIAYLWHSVPGFSKFGSFEGNASANGQSIYLGFQPEIVLYKNTNGTGNWVIYDTARGPYNTNNKRLRVNTNEQEGEVARVNTFSDGFRLVSSSFPNTDNLYLYMAWAKSPFSDLYGGQSNAF